MGTAVGLECGLDYEHFRKYYSWGADKGAVLHAVLCAVLNLFLGAGAGAGGNKIKCLICGGGCGCG